MRSMTGFGKAEGQYGDDFFFTVEISSVNRKQLEVLPLPPPLQNFRFRFLQNPSAAFFSDLSGSL